jgi:hypothetical protein
MQKNTQLATGTTAMFAKTRPTARFFAIKARAKGASPLTPNAARLPTEGLRQMPAGGRTWAVPTVNNGERTYGQA